MINIVVVEQTDRKGVYLRVTLDGIEEALWFYREGASEVESHLLHKEMVKQLDRDLEQIRRVSYLCGWRDAKSKKPKRDWFATFINVLDWEKKDAGL